MFENASEAQLANGLKVIMLENHQAPIVSFQVWYRVGAANETTGKTGLAAMVERMMFKSLGDISAQKFIETIRQMGGRASGAASHDYTCYCDTLVASRIGVAIDFEAQRMRSLKVRDADFRMEKLVVRQERRMRIDDNPESYLLEQLYAAAFQSEPYHWPVMGWTDDLRRLTIADVRAFYSKYYHPANAFLVVAGDFERKELLSRLEESFGKIPPGEPAESFLIEDPLQQGERMVAIRRPGQVARMVVAWHVPNLQSTDSYVLEVIKALLASGKSSRFYDDLIRQGAEVLEISAHYHLTSRNPGLFSICASFLPEKKPEEVQKAICDEMELLKKNPPSSMELQKAKNQLEASFVFNNESIISMASKLAEYEIALDWASISAYIPSIRSVTAQDVSRVAAKYFREQNLTVGVATPPPPVNAGGND
ncbi:MAG: M16 family metallopeptidase [Syntrophobacteraceae bacterium]